MNRTPEREQIYCTFKLDRLFFGIEVERVQEVIKSLRITRVPLARPELRGLINLRGQIVAAVDLRRLLGLPDRTGEACMNVVIRGEDGPVSLLVDEIGDVITPAMDTYEPPPETLAGLARDLTRGVFKLPGGLLLVLDVDRLLTVG